MIKYKLGAVIPTVQYGNIQPEIELEGEDKDELHAEASKFIEGIWEQYSEKPLANVRPVRGETTTYKRIKTFTGEEIFYDEVGHNYMDLSGNKLLSGSAYAEKNSPKFNKELLTPKTAKAWGVDEKELGELWTMNGEVSSFYGSSIHKALEVWHKFNSLGSAVQAHKELEENYCLPKNVYLQNIVKEFDEKFGRDAAVELFVSDAAHGMVGQIDRLQILDFKNKVCRIGDYKTNNDLDDKKIAKYQHQLSFYAHILINMGWKVEGLDIFHHDGEVWSKIELDVLELIP